MNNLTQVALVELAQWLDERREAEYDTGELIESVDHKMRTLGGSPPRRTDPIPVVAGPHGDRWTYLRAALTTAEREASRS